MIALTIVAKRIILDACKAPSYISGLIVTPERKYITHILTQLFKLRITFSGFQGMLLGTVKSCKKVKPFFVVLQRLCRNQLLLHSLPVLINWQHRFLIFFFTLFGNVVRSFLDRTLNKLVLSTSNFSVCRMWISFIEDLEYWKDHQFRGL